MRHVVSVYEAKTQLSKLLEALDEGEQVVITKRGKPVADLILHRPAKHYPGFGKYLFPDVGGVVVPKWGEEEMKTWRRLEF